MTNKKITELTSLGGASVSDSDVFPVVDVDATETKKITATELAVYLAAELQATIEELARDALASALTAGSNITITPNDGANTITIAATGAGGGGVDVLDDLSDVDLTGAATGDVLAKDGTEWVPATALVLDPSPPANGDVLTYNTGTASWGPSSPFAGTSDNLRSIPAINEYFTCSTIYSNAANQGSDGVIGLLPMLITTAMTVDRIACNVDVSQSAGTVRLGIYDSDINNRPSGLLLDAGTVAATSTGNKEITINQALTPGLYWLAAVPQGTSGVKYRAVNAVVYGMNMSTSFNDLTSGPVAFKGQSGATGALPPTITIAYTGAGRTLHRW